MPVLIGGETSGMLRTRLNAISCDLLPAEDNSPNHIIGDMFEVVASRYWDLAIFHPTCTYLTNSAAWAYNDPDYERYPAVGYHQRVKPGTLVGAARREARANALADFRRLIDLASWYCDRWVIENPIGAANTAVMAPSQIIQPYNFGDDASKATCLWLYNLPLLVGTKYIPPRRVNGLPRWSNQTDTGQNRLSPGEDRWKERSRTFPGIADAIGDQYGHLSLHKAA